MYFIKRLFLYLFIILLLISVYKDIMSGHHIPGDQLVENKQSVSMDFQVTQIKVKPGETVLSIIEKINNHDIQTRSVSQIIDDFKLANPNTDPYQLKAGNFYYFPLYFR